MALGLYVLMQSLPIGEALRVAPTTDKEKVEVLPHMAEGGLPILINHSAVGTEGQLPAPPSNGE